jgi:hypothetical protein
LKGRALAWNRSIAYRDINWVGVIRRRQWGMLVLAAIFLPLGIFWSVTNVGNWGPMAVGLAVLLLMGIVPMAIFLRGRAFLGIAAPSAMIALPMDRHKKAIRRILGLLRQQAIESAVWQLEVTEFGNPEMWDHRAPSGKPFNQKRYIMISLLLGLYGGANLLGHELHAKLIARGVMIGVVIIALVWIISAAWARIWRR